MMITIRILLIQNWLFLQWKSTSVKKNHQNYYCLYSVFLGKDQMRDKTVLHIRSVPNVTAWSKVQIWNPSNCESITIGIGSKIDHVEPTCHSYIINGTKPNQFNLPWFTRDTPLKMEDVNQIVVTIRFKPNKRSHLFMYFEGMCT